MILKPTDLLQQVSDCCSCLFLCLVVSWFYGVHWVLILMSMYTNMAFKHVVVNFDMAYKTVLYVWSCSCISYWSAV